MTKHSPQTRRSSGGPLIALTPPVINDTYAMPPRKRCLFCEAWFLPVIKGRHRRYCSDSCKMRAYRQRKQKEI